jgi:hypothetical protein
LAEALERECRVPIYDTVATTVWKSLQLAGEDVRQVRARLGPPVRSDSGRLKLQSSPERRCSGTDFR